MGKKRLVHHGCVGGVAVVSVPAALDRVGVMDRDVEDDAGTRLGARQPPGPHVVGQRTGMEHPGGHRLADRALAEEIVHRDDRRGAPEMVVDSDHDPRRIGGGPPARHEQLVHNDFRSANLLHDGTSITAVLDFEEVTYRTTVADLAKATVLLGTRYHDWGPTSPLVREAFVAAYRDRVPLTSAEHNELQREIAVILTNLGWA